MRLFFRAILFLGLGIHSIFAQLSLADVFTDDMVLQRNQPIHFCGTGKPGSIVEVEFGDTIKKNIVKNDSTWSLFFKKQEANSAAQTIHISSDKHKITLSNVLIGDLWLCIGQSNMEWPMAKEMNFKKEQQHTDQPLLRFYNPTYAGKNVYNKVFGDSILRRLTKKNFYQGHWRMSDSNSVKTMSAVGYYFGKKIMKTEAIPIGLIHLAIGGAPIETFIKRESLNNDSRFSEKIRGNWLANENIPVWIRERGRQNVGAAENVPSDELGPNHAFKPGFAHAAGIDPLTCIPIKGIIWYQGESNAQEPKRVKEYGELQKLMIQGYRKKWKQPKLPFFWVQLSAIDTANYYANYWPAFRNEQRRLLDEIPYGGMAVTSDIGAKNDVHPTNKKDVGERLARWAMKQVYRHDIVHSGPLPYSAVFKDQKVVVSYEHCNGLTTSDGKPLRGFSLDGKTPVKAHIKKDKIVIPAVRKPKFLYYAWQPWTEANLINSEELPATTFKIKVE